MVSKRLQEIPASGTIAISNLVSQMKAEGVDIVSFSMGEPDFTTPENIIDACCDALHSGFTHYTPSMGIPELREAVADMESRVDGVPCRASNVLITPTKQAIFMIALAYINPGDEVILPDPSWVSYEACVRLAGGVPVYIPTKFEDEFVVDPALIEAAITPRTRMIILNTPSNPTGTVIPREVLRQIADIAIANDLLVLSDEIYESIIYEGKHTSIASFPEMFDRTLLVSGLSKTYAMTGWRLGWMVVPEYALEAMDDLATNFFLCAHTPTQHAALACFTPETLAVCEERRQELLERRRIVVDGLAEIGLPLEVEPNGAFYAYFNISGTGLDAWTFCERALKEAHVALTPGRDFGNATADTHVRLSYAASREALREGLKRLGDFVARLRG